MPNWCENTLELKGPLADITDIVYKLEKVDLKGPLELFVPIGEWDYEKACDTWGIKWDVQLSILKNTCLMDMDGTTTITFGFASAWGPPIEGISAWSKSYPNTEFRIAWAEIGCSQWGVSIIQDGETIEDNGGEIPSFLPDPDVTEWTDAIYDKAAEEQYEFITSALESLSFT